MALRWADVDLGRGEARIAGSLVRIDGYLVVAETKTARSRRSGTSNGQVSWEEGESRAMQ